MSRREAPTSVRFQKWRTYRLMLYQYCSTDVIWLNWGRGGGHIELLKIIIVGRTEIWHPIPTKTYENEENQW